MSWPAYLATVSIDGALPIRFAAGDVLPSGAESVSAFMVVPSLDGSGQITIRQTFALPPFDAETAAGVLFDFAAYLYRHEIKEQLAVAGVRAFDPGPEHESW